MNHDEKFQQRWEFRRKGDEEDSSTDDSRTSGERVDKKHSVVNDLVLPQNDEISDAPVQLQHDNRDTNNAAPKKVGSSKKKNAQRKKPKKLAVVKKNQKNKKSLSLNAAETAMLDDLKAFSASLIHELEVARQGMSQQMWQEMRKLVPSRPTPEPVKKKGRSSQKKKVQQPQNKTKSDVKTQKRPRRSLETSKKSNLTSDASNFSKAVESNEPHKVEENTMLQPTKTQVVLSTDSDRLASAPFLTLPAVVPKPQLQNQRNGIPLNDHNTAGVPRNVLGSETEVGKLIDPRTSYHGFPAFQPAEQLGSFPQISCRSVGFLAQTSSQTAAPGIGFPVPLHQGLGISSNISIQTYPENSFRDKTKVGLRRSTGALTFPGGIPALPQYVFTNSISSTMHHKTDGELASLRNKQ
ncbi:hypothetical protein Salat_1842200 [Sesamum alatum]|uniref:Uncharacterized protein n=1 Tax=Sesamum alatum TaxID=300844 RepID=A0AAE2CHS9_9LAMI|nr:hypothetical protein Salat_1842200 [Sesamum alatum]